tara:strand:- start:1238 stop:1489 length:252 start_codon:yes stop_codon:yes gene_type:complete
MSEIAQSDSAAVRWAARLVYCAMAPFVLVVGLLVDLHSFLLRVARTVHNAFGGIDPAVPEVFLFFLYGVTCIAIFPALSLVLS